jgi:hypothetical protein
LAEQLKPVALDLAVVRKAVKQLAANQQQLAAKERQDNAKHRGTAGDRAKARK